MDSAISVPQIILMGGWIVIYAVDSAIHQINHYPADEYYGNQLRYPLDRDLSGG